MSLNVNIKKRLGHFVLDVNFASSGGITGLLGASGCGKTVTLKCIAGIITPDSGRIVLNGITLFDSKKRINLPPQQRNVGYLFQNYALFPNMTLEQNISCGLRHEKDRKARINAVKETIKRMQLTGLERHRPHQLSGGQQQRTALGRILVGNPEILMLDEPLSALDAYLKDQVLSELMSTLKEFNKDTLLVTHSRDEAYQLCSKLAIMDRGNIESMGDTKQVFADPYTRSGALITGCKNITPAKKVGETLVEAPEWGIVLDAGRPVGEKICAIGIRAHYFGEDILENAFPICVTGGIEGPFEWTIKFRYSHQREDSNPIWWRIPKDAYMEHTPVRLGVAADDILLLYS